MKKYKVVIAQSARGDLDSIRQYIIDEYEDAHAADVTLSRILDKIEALALFPRATVAHRYGLSKALRFAHSQKYTIVYSVDDTSMAVYVEAIINSRRNIASMLENRNSGAK